MSEALDALPEDRTIQWGEATFTINKMLPVEAKSVFMAHVRPLCQGILADVGEVNTSKEVSPVDWINDLIKPENSAATWKLIAAAFINAPYREYQAISVAMSRSITVKRGQESRVLQGNEEWAFQGLEGAHMMILEARAFMVNYSPFFGVLMSELSPLIQAFGSNMPPMSMNISEISSQSQNSN